MGGIFDEGSSMADTAPALAGIRVQTSMYGLTIPVAYGRNRIAGNLLGYYGFRSTPVEERSTAGKGGSAPVRTSYSYSASIIMALAEGPVGFVRAAWVGKEKFVGAAASTRVLDATEISVVPTTPYQVTVAQSATFIAAASVACRANWDGLDFDLVEGTDFTRVGGVYTFSSGFAGRTVEIHYQYSTAVDAVSALGGLGLQMKAGVVGQTAWSYLTTNYPSEALAYSPLAYIYAQDYPLTNSAQVENHNFECDFQLQYSASIPDADPAAVIKDILTNRRYGAQFDALDLASTAAYSNYCVASGLLISPVYTSQRAARDVIEEILEQTNADACWTGETLRLVPRGDVAVTGNGITYTPDNTTIFSIGPADYADNSNEPVTMTIKDPADRYNRVTIEYVDRDNNYVVVPCEAKDEAAQFMYTLRPEPVQGARLFALASAAQAAAQIRLQRHQAAIATYAMTLPWRFLQLELGDLCLLTEPQLGLTNVCVKLVEMTENFSESQGVTFSCVFEDFPIGHANAPLYAPQEGTGYSPNLNVDPGVIATPMFFEPPGSSVGGTGLAVWIAASGTQDSWGGCDVYASMDDGVSFKFVSRVEQSARYGALSAPLAAGAGSSLSVALAGIGGTLRTTSAADAEALSTLCYVADSAGGEWLAFQTATLTAPKAYTLTGLVRGRYGSADAAHASGAKFVFLDSAIATSSPLPLSMVGKVIKFKFCSYNVHGGAVQSLATAPEYSYRITGAYIGQTGRPISANKLPNAAFDGGCEQVRFYWAGNDSLGDIGGLYDLRDAAHAAVRMPGSPSNALIWQSGAACEYAFALWPKVSVTPGVRIVAYAGLLGHRCNGRIQVQWLDAAGSILSQELGNTVAGNPVKDPQKAGDYSQSFLFAYPPAGAVSAQFLALKWATLSGADSGLYVHAPFVGVALAEQTELPVWEAGGINTVGEAQIAAGATYDLKHYENAASVAVTAVPGARTLLTESATIGPYNMATKVILSGSSSLTYGGPGAAAGSADGPRLYVQYSISSGALADTPTAFAPPITVADSYHYYNGLVRKVVDLPAGSTLFAKLYATAKPWHVAVTASLSMLDVEITKLR